MMLMLVVLLLIVIPAGSSADVSTNALVSYLTGLPELTDTLYADSERFLHPARLALDDRPSLDVFRTGQEVVRSLRGPQRKVQHALTAIGVKYRLLHKRSGMYISIADKNSTFSLPLSSDKITIGDTHDTGRAHVSVFASPVKNLRAGFTVGRRLYGDGNGSSHIVEIAGESSHGFGGALSYYSRPYEWGIAAEYGDITKVLSSRIRIIGFDGSFFWSAPWETKFCVTMKRKAIVSPGSAGGISGNHEQKWDGDWSSLQLRIGKNPFPGIKVSAYYGMDTLSGEMNTFYDGSRYLRAMLDGVISHIGMEAVFDRCSRYIPLIRYDRTAGDFSLSHGSADNWPFTPKQVEVIGDKTWTFSGTGTLVADNGTLTWKNTQSGVSLAYVRVHPGYRLRTTERDHFSTSPLAMLAGKRSILTDTTKFYDFVSVTYMREFPRNTYSVVTGFQQLIPVYHAKKRIPGSDAPQPSFPKMNLSSPRNFGGFSMWLRIHYYL